MDSAFGFQGQPDAFGLRAQGAGLGGAFGQEAATQANERLLEEEREAQAYKPQTYDANQLVWHDGAFYAAPASVIPKPQQRRRGVDYESAFEEEQRLKRLVGSPMYGQTALPFDPNTFTKLNPLDQLKYTQITGGERYGREGISPLSSREATSPLWGYLAQIQSQGRRNPNLGILDDYYERQYGETDPQSGQFQITKPNELNAIRQQMLGAFKNYELAPEERFDQFRKNYGDALYGGYYLPTSSGRKAFGFTQHADPSDPYAWMGQELTLQTDPRGNIAMSNARTSREALYSMFPMMSKRKIDEAAAKALNQRSYQHYWGGTPGNIMNEIAKYLPEKMPQQGVDWINRHQGEWAEQRRKAKKSIHKAEDAASGLTGFMADLGPLSALAYLTPAAPFMAALQAASGIEGLHEGTMKPGQAFMRMIPGIAKGLGALSGSAGAGTSAAGYENAFDTGAMADAAGYTSSSPEWVSSIGSALGRGDIGGAMTAAEYSPLSSVGLSPSGLAKKALLERLTPEQKQKVMAQQIARSRQVAARPGRPNRAFGLANFVG